MWKIVPELSKLQKLKFKRFSVVSKNSQKLSFAMEKLMITKQKEFYFNQRKLLTFSER